MLKARCLMSPKPCKALTMLALMTCFHLVYHLKLCFPCFWHCTSPSLMRHCPGKILHLYILLAFVHIISYMSYQWQFHLKMKEMKGKKKRMPSQVREIIQFNTYIIVIQQSVCTFSKFELSESRVGAAWHPVSYFHTNWNLALCFFRCTLYSWQVQDSNLHCRWEANGSVLAHPKTLNWMGSPTPPW